MRNIVGPGVGIHPAAVLFFDKVGIRTGALPAPFLRQLQEHSPRRITCELGKRIRGRRDTEQILTVVCPDRIGLQLLGSLPDSAFVNYLEVACDTPSDAPDQLRHLFDRHFVQGWHGERQNWLAWGGSYTGRPKHRHKFVWYFDKPSKITGQRCFHLEARYAGLGLVRRLGIDHPRDLLSFDHQAYWRRYLKLYQIDFERLGRFHCNRQEGSRRRSPRIDQGKISYNRDHAIGCRVYRHQAAHDHQEHRSIQRFIDTYGRGPYLIHYCFNIPETKLSAKSPITAIETEALPVSPP